MATVTFIGGRYDAARADITRQPLRVLVGGALYERVDDPDDGVPLGAYISRDR